MDKKLLVLSIGIMVSFGATWFERIVAAEVSSEHITDEEWTLLQARALHLTVFFLQISKIVKGSPLVEQYVTKTAQQYASMLKKLEEEAQTVSTEQERRQIAKKGLPELYKLKDQLQLYKVKAHAAS